MLKLKLQYLAIWYEELTHLKRPWCWERLKAGEEGDDKGWNGWMASPTQWPWVWVNSGSWWWTGRPGMLQFMGSQWAGHDRATKLNWTEPNFQKSNKCSFLWSLPIHFKICCNLALTSQAPSLYSLLHSFQLVFPTCSSTNLVIHFNSYFWVIDLCMYSEDTTDL